MIIIIWDLNAGIFAKAVQNLHRHSTLFKVYLEAKD
jgi:hypothetical protein